MFIKFEENDIICGVHPIFGTIVNVRGAVDSTSNIESES